GEHLYDGVRQGRPAGTSEAEPGEGGVCSWPVRQTCQSALCGSATIQRVRGTNQRRSLRRQLAAARTQDRRRPAVEEVLSRIEECGTLVLHGIDHTVHD